MRSKAFNPMIFDEEKIASLEAAGWRFVGRSRHSAVKPCEWLKKSVRGEGYCYKQKFYGIKSHQCLQLSPAVPFCTHRCAFCWRDTSFTYPKWKGKVDAPVEIIEEAIKQQRQLLTGFGGYKKVNARRLKEAQNPRHVAISLAGEPTLYPRIAEFLEETKKRGMTSFVVTNGTNPKTVEEIEPTQLYVTLPAPNEEVYKRTCSPLIRNGWRKINETLSLLPSISPRKVIRLTLVRQMNLCDPEGYANLIGKAEPDFVEVKAFMSVGFSRQRLAYERMPLHNEIREFARQISDSISYPIADEKTDSRVVLLSKNGKKRKLKKA